MARASVCRTECSSAKKRETYQLVGLVLSSLFESCSAAAPKFALTFSWNGIRSVVRALRFSRAHELALALDIGGVGVFFCDALKAGEDFFGFCSVVIL